MSHLGNRCLAGDAVGRFGVVSIMSSNSAQDGDGSSSKVRENLMS
jgi:hypothetical protein